MDALCPALLISPRHVEYNFASGMATLAGNVGFIRFMERENLGNFRTNTTFVDQGGDLAQLCCIRLVKNMGAALVQGNRQENT